MSVAELSPKPQAIHDRLPATVGELSEEFGIRRSTVRDHLSNIDDVVGLEKVDRDGDTEYRPSRDGEPDKTQDDSLPPSKQSITKKANRHLIKLERRVAELLEDAEPLDVDVDTGGREDVVIHRTDAHIGSVVEDEFGNEVFNEDVAVERERTVTEKTVRLVERQEAAGYEFGTSHLLLGGDLVTGENIFNGQAHDISATVDEQIDIAAELYYEQIQELAELFPAVQVVCQLGNHGEIRGSGMSEAANFDRIIYMMLEKMVRASGLDNVKFLRNDATHFTNFQIRDHNAHLRHGHNSLEHIGTSSGKNRWRGWKLKHKFDIAYWGHYHTFEMDEVFGDPVIRSGSIRPPDDFEEGLSEGGKPAATIHGASDSYPLTWFFPINF